MKPILAALQAASSPSERPSMRWSATEISPASTRSIPPSRLSGVVLPEPDGPMTAMKSPRGIARSRWSKIEIVSLPLVKRLLTPVRRTIGCSAVTLVSLEDSGSKLVRGGGFSGALCLAVFFGVSQEIHLHRHIGQDARVLLVEADAHLHRGLLAVRGRHDRDHRGGNGPVRIGIQHRVHGAAGDDPADEGFVDVDFDFD